MFAAQTLTARFVGGRDFLWWMAAPQSVKSLNKVKEILPSVSDPVSIEITVKASVDFSLQTTSPKFR